MGNFIIYLATFFILFSFYSCSQKDDDNASKQTFQILADKEKELNDREARLKLKEIELDEREKRINGEFGIDQNATDTSGSTTLREQSNDSLKNVTENNENKTGKKKSIQKEITKRFENPAGTVKDYYEYIQRGINEEGNFDSNMKKAHKYFPSRPVEKLKSGYRNTKSFTVIQEPKVIAKKDDKATVVSKVKQTQIIKKDGKNVEVTKTLTVTYNLTAKKNGEWVITGNTVKQSN